MPEAPEHLRASVVVPTRDRAPSLERLLYALEAQTLARDEFEILIVDDGSIDGTPERLARFTAHTRMILRRLRHASPRGPAVARNIGIRAARGEIVAFTDDDCVPAPNWLEAGLAAVAAGAAIVMGRTVADPHAAGYGKRFSRTMEVIAEDGRYPTCNVFYLREALIRAGGFDEAFRQACGEDTDLAWRVKGLGYRSGFAMGAVVAHDVRPPSFTLFLKERRRFADQILLVKRHPHLRTLYYRRYFYQRSHVHAIATLALIAMVLYGIEVAALPLPLVWLDRFRHTPFSESWAKRTIVGAQMLAGDLWELVVFGYCSLRYRTLLL